MSPGQLPCLKALDRNCFRAHPEFARRALAYRLLHLLIPPDLARLLPKTLRDPLVAPGVEVPLGAVFPPGTVIIPGCDFPAGWDPKDEPPECTKSRPLPTLAMMAAGANPNVFLSPGEPGTGQVKPGPGPPPEEHGSGTYYPAASQDDGEWSDIPGFASNTVANHLGQIIAWLYKTYITSNTVMAPQGATIITATLTLFATSDYSSDDITVDIHANDVDSPTNPTDETEADALALTTATVPWTQTDWTQHQSYVSPELKDIIQEIVNRPGWTAGNNLMLILKTQTGSGGLRASHSYDYGTPAYYSQLYVEW
ncbi:hypothetical protein ES703_14520 [subsurface metagenome]